MPIISHIAEERKISTVLQATTPVTSEESARYRLSPLTPARAAVPTQQAEILQQCENNVSNIFIPVSQRYRIKKSHLRNVHCWEVFLRVLDD